MSYNVYLTLMTFAIILGAVFVQAAFVMHPALGVLAAIITACSWYQLNKWAQ